MQCCASLNINFLQGLFFPQRLLSFNTFFQSDLTQDSHLHPTPSPSLPPELQTQTFRCFRSISIEVFHWHFMMTMSKQSSLLFLSANLQPGALSSPQYILEVVDCCSPTSESSGLLNSVTWALPWAAGHHPDHWDHSAWHHSAPLAWTIQSAHHTGPP